MPTEMSRDIAVGLAALRKANNGKSFWAAVASSRAWWRLLRRCQTAQPRTKSPSR